MARILFVIAPERFQEIEYGVPKKILSDYGHEIVTTSTVERPTDKEGNPEKADLLLKDVNPENYDAVAFIGGPGSHFYFTHEPALNLAREFARENKLTCAICAAPVILAHAGLLDDKTVTCYPTREEDLRNMGIEPTGNPVEHDGIFITANGPEAAEAFAQEIHKTISA